ncbi:extracellular solute-binding protein [Kitasatospora sp. NPDC001603]|uniref:extracellular solute-binding protein n=1 Tax=Kitasatospora sp. NPDC001603 TaxID=3154388 RepID=UPI003332F821
MQWCGLWAMPALRTALGDDFGVLPWPASRPGGGPVVRVGGWTSCVNARSRNVAAAKTFVRWLRVERTEPQKDWSESYGFHVPPRLSVAARSEGLRGGTAQEAVDLAAKCGRYSPALWNSTVNTLFAAAAVKVVGGGDAAQIPADAARQAQAEIDRQRA